MKKKSDIVSELLKAGYHKGSKGYKKEYARLYAEQKRTKSQGGTEKRTVKPVRGKNVKRRSASLSDSVGNVQPPSENLLQHAAKSLLVLMGRVNAKNVTPQSVDAACKCAEQFMKIVDSDPSAFKLHQKIPSVNKEVPGPLRFDDLGDDEKKAGIK